MTEAFEENTRPELPDTPDFPDCVHLGACADEGILTPDQLREFAVEVAVTRGIDAWEQEHLCGSPLSRHTDGFNHWRERKMHLVVAVSNAVRTALTAQQEETNGQ